MGEAERTTSLAGSRDSPQASNPTTTTTTTRLLQIDLPVEAEGWFPYSTPTDILPPNALQQ